MILDSEEQRNNLLSCVREVTLSGRMEDVIQIVNMLKGLEHDLTTAQIGPQPCVNEELKIVNDE